MEKIYEMRFFPMKRFLPLLLIFALLCLTAVAAAPPNGTVNVRLYNYSHST